MEIKINKEVLLENYIQYMMDNLDDSNAWDNVKNTGTPVNEYIQNERILDTLPDNVSTEPATINSKPIPERYPYFDNDSIQIIRKGMHGDVGLNNQPFKISKGTLEQGVQNTHDWQVRLGQTENSGYTHGGNIPINGANTTTAHGLYQFTNDTATTDLKRGLRDGVLHQETMPWVQQASNGLTYNSPSSKFDIDVSKLSRPEMTNLSLAHQIGQGNGKYQFHNIPEGNTDAQLKQNYYKIHHTHPDVQTIQNANDVFNKDIKNIHIRPENEINYNYKKYLASK